MRRFISALVVFFFATPCFSATINITTQDDLENISDFTANSTYVLQNDIALSNWSIIGRPWAGATFDGNGHKLTGLTTLSGNAIKEGVAGGYSSLITISSGYNIGTVHTMAFTVQVVTGTSYSIYVFGSGNEAYGSVRLQNNNAIVYRCGDGTQSVNQSWTTSALSSQRRFVIVRNGTSVTLYQDGVSLGTKVLSQNYAFTRCDEIARNASGTWGAYFNELMITTDAKDQAWVTADYNGGFYRYTTTTNTPNIANLWHAREGTGTTIVDSVGGKNGINVDGWASFPVKSGFINSMSSGTIKNVTIDTPVVTNSIVASDNGGGIVNSMSGGSVDGCSVLNASITSTGGTPLGYGGVVGSMSGGSVSNCFTSINNLPTINAETRGSAGIVGAISGGSITNCYSTDGSALVNSPDSGIVNVFSTDSSLVNITNSFSTATVGVREISGGSGGPNTSTDHYYDQSKGGDVSKLPVVHLTMNDNAGTTAVVDSSRYANPGTSTVNTSTISVAGKVNTALNFVRSANNRVVVADNSTNNYRTITAMAWVYIVDSANDGNWCIVEKAPHDNRWEFFAIRGVGGATLMCRGGSVSPAFNGSVQIPYNTWTHVAVTFNNTVASFYINGLFSQSSNVTGVNTSAGAIYVGNSSNNLYGFSGYIDDVRVYTSVLSASDISAIYNSGTGTEAELTQLSQPQALKSYFYNVANTPMSGWDFTPTGSWSTTQNTVTYPPLQTNFSGNISGTVSGYTSGKSMKLTVSEKVYSVKDQQSGTAYGKFATPPTIDNLFTIAFTATISGNTIIIRKASTGDSGLFLLNGNQWKWGQGTGSPLSINIAPLNSFVSGTHRYVLTRNGTTLKWYVDGNLIQTTTYTNTTTTNTNAMEGILQGASGGGFSGATVYSFLITTDEKDQAWVTADWNGGLLKRYDSTLPNCIMGYHFDEVTGSVFDDFSSSSNDMTFQAPPIRALRTIYPLFTDYSTTTIGSGDFAFTSVVGDHGRPISIYIDGEAVKGSVVATLPDGLTAPVTGVSMKQNTLSIGESHLHPAVAYDLANSAMIIPTEADQLYRTASNTIYYNGGAECLLPTGTSFIGKINPDTAQTGGLTIDGVGSLSAVTLNDLDVNGTLTTTSSISANDVNIAGSWTASINPYILGDWTNSGTYSGSVIFNSATPTITGDTTWNSFSNIYSGAVLTFNAGDTFTINSSLALGGTVGNLTQIQSSSSGDKFIINNGTGSPFDIEYVQVTDSEVSGDDIVAYHSTGTNTDKREASPHWVFPVDINAFILEHN